MAYKALYRTYRPQSFSEIIGQEAIVKTLQNEIKENKVSHAYLFSGPRGTGKTSIARVFAKALNCPHLVEGEPCNECSTCKEITEGVNPDVIEIDAASNNGVDEIRAMKDRIGFLPAGSKYKVYIIDEVHMLSTSAFNAFLKTLEEPPKHVIFILATTEPQKILPTVLSRCQRYDFKSLTVEEILDVLEKVCISEDVDYDNDALIHIAKASDGGLRDALSYLDQAVSYCGDKITDEDAANVTGTVAKDKLFALTKAMKDKNLAESINLINELQNSGKEVSKIVNGLLEFYRDILMVKNIKTEYTDQRYVEYASNTTFDEIFYYINVLSDVQNKIRYSNSTSIYLQVAIIRIINTSSIDLDYQKRIAELEEKLNNIGQVEVQGSVDNTQVKELEDKYTNLLAYLNKMGIQSFNERIRALENNQAVIANGNTKELESKLYKVIEDIEFLKVTYSGMRNAVDNASNGGISEEDLVMRVEEATKKYKPSINYTEIESFVKKQIDGVMEDVRAIVVKEAKKEVKETIDVATTDLVNNTKNEIVDEVKDSLKSDLEQGIKSNIENSLKSNIKDEVINEVNDQINNQINEKLKDFDREIYKNKDQDDNQVITEKIIETKEIVVKPEGLSDELEKRLEGIETKLYTLMADLVQRTQAVSKKNKPKVDEKQISFWGGDIVENEKTTNTSNKIKAHFEGLDESYIIKKESTDETKEPVVQSENVSFENKVTEVQEQDIDLNEQLDKDLNINEVETVDNAENTDNVIESIELEVEESNIQNEDESELEQEDLFEENEILLEDPVFEEEVNLFAEDDKDILLDDEHAKQTRIELELKQKEEERKKQREAKVAELVLIKRRELEQKNTSNKEEEKIERKLENKEDTLEQLEEQNNIANSFEKSPQSLNEVNAQEISDNLEQDELTDDNLETSLKEDEENIFGGLFDNQDSENDKTKDIEKEIKEADVEDLDEYEKYDVKVLERILNDSREIAYSGEKERIEKLWKNLIDLAPSDKRGTAEILSEGTVRAVGNHELVITYDSARICNQVMSRKFKRNSMKLLYDILGDDYNYLAITTEQWTLKRQEYVNQYVIGVKYPKLTPFTDPNLKVVINEDDEDDVMKKVVIDIFGSNVKFKKE